MVHSFIRKYRTLKRDVRREESLDGDGSRDRSAGRFAGREKDPLEAAMARERDEQLANAVEQLPPHQRQVFRMRTEEELSFEEVGQRLGISADAAQKLWSRAIRCLRERLGGWR